MSKLNYLALRPVMAKQFPNMPEAAREAALGARLRIYEDLSSLPPALGKPLSRLNWQIAECLTCSGRQHFQRQLRTVVRRVSIPSPVSIGCWVTVSALVKNLTKRIMAADSEATVPRRRGLAEIDGLDEVGDTDAVWTDDQDSARFWQDSVAVLAAYSAVCLFDGPQPPGVADLVGKGILPKVYDEIGDAAAAAESFIRDCVDLLICNSLTVRETVKEALGSELQPSLCRVLVTQMSK
jgi:neurofibromin 1